MPSDNNQKQDFSVRFWGTRGSLPCPGPEFISYGGNTSCIELRCGEHLFILDMGSGARSLGLSLLKEDRIDADILYTHTHIDHIMGFPFFVPFFQPQNRFRLWAGHLAPTLSLYQTLEMLMVAPLFPISLDMIQSEIYFEDFRAGHSFNPRPGVTIHTHLLNHPNDATGYRIAYQGRTLCYVTDIEHTPGQLDQNIVDFVRDANVMIYDSTYTDEEFSRYISWGHSTWQEAIRIADAAHVGQVIFFHHDPSHDDAIMEAINVEAQKIRGGSAFAAREGMILSL